MLQQISVFVKNRIGAALEVTQTLAEGAYSIRAFSIYDTPEFSILRLIFEESVCVTTFLEERGFFVKSSPVVGVVLEDEAGYLNAILRLAQTAEIQINYMYSLVLRSDNKPVMIIHSDQDEKLESVLIESGFALI